MIIFLRCWFALVLVSMIAVTVWASTQTAIWMIPPGVLGHPWFIATLFDTCFAFIAFFCWVAYKENCAWRSALWLIGILLLGNLVIAAYCLIQLFKVRTDASLRDVLVRS